LKGEGGRKGGFIETCQIRGRREKEQLFILFCEVTCNAFDYASGAKTHEDSLYCLMGSQGEREERILILILEEGGGLVTIVLEKGEKGRITDVILQKEEKKKKSIVLEREREAEDTCEVFRSGGKGKKGSQRVLATRENSTRKGKKKGTGALLKRKNKGSVI